MLRALAHKLLNIYSKCFVLLQSLFQQHFTTWQSSEEQGMLTFCFWCGRPCASGKTAQMGIHRWLQKSKAVICCDAGNS